MRAASFLARRMAAASGRRAMSSAHGHGHNYPHGMHFHVSPVHKNLALAYGTMLWLWVFWRAKQDGRAVLGLEHPWDHGHGHHEAHAEAAPKGYALVDGKIKYERSEIGALPMPVEIDGEEEETEESTDDDVMDDLHDADEE
ncbi:uncharacterized protein IUM83_14227 [Phytophthora cinnamomi]|uniref:uncharacterized protein n=1 Tax=Phytophthora cinnamomi TaxID=4785 RepID=UPI00355A831B|nr:hypothetical protein IUM83_14227 [Phytophthora cinnamomi]